MNKKQRNFLLVLSIMAVGSIIVLLFIAYSTFSLSNSNIIIQTVIVEVTPTFTPVPTPTATTFPTDRDRIVFLSVWENDFYLMNGDGSSLVRITNDGENNERKSCPSWHPDGQRISFFIPSTQDGYYDIYIMNADGRNLQKLFQAKLDSEYGQTPQWSSDGTKLAFSAYDEYSKDSHIYIYDGKSEKRLITNSDSRERFPVWSPDGSKIAFISYNTGKPLLVAASYYGNEFNGYEAWLVSNLPTSNFYPPTWSPDGKLLAFVSENDLYIAEFNDSWSPDRRTKLSRAQVVRPIWSPVDDLIAFYYEHPNYSSSDLSTITGKTETNVETLTFQVWAYESSPISWSADGKKIAITGDTDTENWNIYIAKSYGGEEIQITDSDRRDHCPSFSP